MKLFSLSILYKGQDKVNKLCAAHDLSSFGYFQKSRYRLNSNEFVCISVKLSLFSTCNDADLLHCTGYWNGVLLSFNMFK